MKISRLDPFCLPSMTRPKMAKFHPFDHMSHRQRGLLLFGGTWAGFAADGWRSLGKVRLYLLWALFFFGSFPSGSGLIGGNIYFHPSKESRRLRYFVRR